MTPGSVDAALKTALADEALAGKVGKATGHTLNKRRTVIEEHYPDWEDLREEAREIRKRALENLPDLIETFTRKVVERGGTVTIVENARQANALVHDLVKPFREAPIVKAKSMVTEEIGLRPYLIQRGFEVVETDLGEFIIQVLGQLPSHITAPAIHLSREDIGIVFHEKLGAPETTDPHELTLFARNYLREKFLSARAGITGANFLVAESGSVVLLENEANIRLTTTLPERIVTVTGVDKLLAETGDLAPLLKLLPVSATGQLANTYTTFLPVGENHHVILLKGWRWQVRSDPDFADILTCIRCGACLNVCPVYRVVGGHAYASVYPGPIGAVLSPFLSDKFKKLPFLSTLCGACTEVCPVKIPLHDMLLRHRARAEKPVAEQALFSLFRLSAHPLAYRVGTGLLRLVPKGVRDLLMKPWTKNRGTFPIARHGFRSLWRRR